MYITISSIKKTLGKYIEFTDLYIGLPMFLTVCVFLMIPINLSKKNRMYRVMGLFFKYLISNKTYIFFKWKRGDDYRVIPKERTRKDR